jgi:hypothetical protein
VITQEMVNQYGVNIIPSVADLQQAVQAWGTASQGTCLFYSGLGDTAPADIKQWYQCNIESMDTDPFTGQTPRPPVTFDDFVDPDLVSMYSDEFLEVDSEEWLQVNGRSVSAGFTFMERVSQAFAAECTGVAYYFSNPGILAEVPDVDTVWGGWELPALVRNEQMSALAQVFPAFPTTNVEGQWINPRIFWQSYDGYANYIAPRGNEIWYQDEVPGVLED